MSACLPVTVVEWVLPSASVDLPLRAVGSEHRQPRAPGRFDGRGLTQVQQRQMVFDRHAGRAEKGERLG